MPLMRSPDGSETLEVPLEQVRYYISKGASLAQPLSQRLPGGTPYSGTPETYIDRTVAGPGAFGLNPSVSQDPLRGGSDMPTPGRTQGGVPWWADPTDIPAMFLAGPAAEAVPLTRGAGAAARGGVNAGMGAIEGTMALAGKVARAPFIKRFPGARMVRGMAEDVAAVAAKRAGRIAPEVAAGAAPAAAAGASQPIVGGAEAAAYQAGGQVGLDAFRAETAKAAETAAEAVPKGKIKVAEHFRAAPKPKGRVVGKIEPELPPSVQKRIDIVAKSVTKTATRRGKNLAQKAGSEAAAAKDVSAPWRATLKFQQEMNRLGVPAEKQPALLKILGDLSPEDAASALKQIANQ
jgi:hypothetical protein